MSNFQRSRSKVWWGDSPPNIGSPIAQASNWNQNNRANEQPDDKDWEPQLPHWVGNNPVQPPVNVNNSQEEVMSPKEVVVNQWPLRHGSPGSHKSQDSGFSDSDSSPTSSQYYPSPEIGVGKSPSNKSSSSSDSNNNENITVKQVIDFKDTPKSSKSLDVLDVPSGSSKMDNGFSTSCPRLRSTSVIQTPYDLQKYIEVHGDEEHMELLKDSTERISEMESPKSEIKITLTPPENINNKKVVDKVPSKKAFVPKKKETNCSKDIKIAKVKDLETSKTKSQDSLEYLQVSEKDHIAINNLPRIRSPISTIPYEPAPDYNLDRAEKSKRPVYSRSHSQQTRRYDHHEEVNFQRNRLNKSLNYEGQRLDQQILDIQDGYHSLGYIDEDNSKLREMTPEVGMRPKLPIRDLTSRNITDSLQLKPHKKFGPKYKQRHASKAKAAQTCSFRIFPTKREKPQAVENYAGGVLEGSRVPSLGLPRYSEQDQWVMVGYPEQEKLVHNERLVGSHREVNLHAKLYEAKDNQPKSAEVKRIPPPTQFQDRIEDTRVNGGSKKSNGDLTHDSKREKLKGSTDNFNVQLNIACTSTPKMLAPNEYMDNINATPQIPVKNTRIRRINLLENFNGNVTHTQNPPGLDPRYQERNIDQTPLERVCERRPESVQYWLCDLVGSCENECMTTLQSKALGTEAKALVSASSATITGNIKKVQTHGQIIVHQYSDVVRQMESQTPSEESLCLLVANVNEFVLAHSITLNTKPPGETPERWDRIKSSLQAYLQRLVEIGEDIRTELNDSGADWRVVGKHLDSLVAIFEETTKAVLVQQLRTLVSIIEEPPSDMILKSTLTSISHLADGATEPENSIHEKCQKLMKSVTELPFVDCGVPRSLLTAVIETNKSSIKALSLRALATICVSGDAVKQFEEGGGMEIISEILNDPATPEPQAREAVTVLAQMTAPWLRDHHDLRQLHPHLDCIVASTTRILSKTECCQLLLLCTACLVNLVREVELEGADVSEKADIVEIMTKHRTVEQVLDAVKKRGPDISVFLQEQTAALLATLSRVPRCIRYLSGVSVVSVALVCFARVSPADRDTRRASELRAQARLLQHTAEAISRLCVLPELASQIVQLEGVPRLIRLVRMQRTRQLPDSGSDQTLLFCLKALRTIHKYHPDVFQQQQSDVEDMLRGHLMQCLMKFSSKKESYV